MYTRITKHSLKSFKFKSAWWLWRWLWCNLPFWYSSCIFPTLSHMSYLRWLIWFLISWSIVDIRIWCESKPFSSSLAKSYVCIEVELFKISSSCSYYDFLCCDSIYDFSTSDLNSSSSFSFGFKSLFSACKSSQMSL